MPYQITFVDSESCGELIGHLEKFQDAMVTMRALAEHGRRPHGELNRKFLGQVCEALTIATADLPEGAKGVPLSLIQAAPKMKGRSLEDIEAYFDAHIGSELRSEGYQMSWLPKASDGFSEDGEDCGHIHVGCGLADGMLQLRLEGEFKDGAPQARGTATRRL